VARGQRTCDHCQKVIDEGNPLAAKLYMTPAQPTKENQRHRHSNYTASMDVGQCCARWLLQLGKWDKRKTRKGGTNGRRTTDTVASRDREQASAA